MASVVRGEAATRGQSSAACGGGEQVVEHDVCCDVDGSSSTFDAEFVWTRPVELDASITLFVWSGASVDSESASEADVLAALSANLDLGKIGGSRHSSGTTWRGGRPSLGLSAS